MLAGGEVLSGGPAGCSKTNKARLSIPGTMKQTTRSVNVAGQSGSEADELAYISFMGKHLDGNQAVALLGHWLTAAGRLCFFERDSLEEHLPSSHRAIPKFLMGLVNEK